MRDTEKNFEISSTQILIFLLENTSFSMDELIDARTYDMTLNRHYLQIGDHVEKINKEVYDTVQQWLLINKSTFLICNHEGKGLREKLDDGCIKETGKQKLYIEMPHFTGRNVPVNEIAKAIGKDAQYIRYGLRMGYMKFGYAYQKEGSHAYNYYCPDKKVWEELGYYSEDKY